MAEVDIPDTIVPAINKEGVSFKRTIQEAKLDLKEAQRLRIELAKSTPDVKKTTQPNSVKARINNPQQPH